MRTAIYVIILALAGTMQLMAQNTIIPPVRESYSQMQPGAASGKTIQEIIPPESVQLIALTRSRGKGSPLTPAFKPDWDSSHMFRHAFASEAKAGGLALSATESTLAEYAIVTKDGEIYLVEVLGDLMRNMPITAILLRGDGFGCRFNFEDYMKKAEQGVAGYPPQRVGSPER